MATVFQSIPTDRQPGLKNKQTSIYCYYYYFQFFTSPKTGNNWA